jgi:hypothetical protein
LLARRSRCLQKLAYDKLSVMVLTKSLDLPDKVHSSRSRCGRVVAIDELFEIRNNSCDPKAICHEDNTLITINIVAYAMGSNDERAQRSRSLGSSTGMLQQFARKPMSRLNQDVQRLLGAVRLRSDHEWMHLRP